MSALAAIAGRWSGAHHDAQPFDGAGVAELRAVVVQALTDIDTLLKVAEKAETVANRHAARVCSAGKECSICELVRAVRST